MSTPQATGSGDGTSSGTDGTQEKRAESAGKRHRKARFRRRFRMPRPSVSKPKRPKLPKPSRPSMPKVRAPKPPKWWGELWFRFVTRLRTVGYWLREKAQAAWGGIQRDGKAVADWWVARSPATKMRIYAVSGVVVLYLVLKFLPVPGVPCQISAAKECAPSNDTIAFVPENAVLYAHVTVESDSHQAELADDLRDQLPGFITILQQSTATLPGASGSSIDVAGAVLPWAKDDFALVGIPGPKKTTTTAYIVGVEDEQKADEFVASIAPAGSKPTEEDEQGANLDVYPGGFASAHSGDELLFGSEAAVRVALAAESGKLPQLEDSDRDAARDALPDVRVAEIYLSAPGMQRFLVGRSGGATQLDTFVDYGASKGMAASATLKDDGIEINLVSDLDPKLEEQSPTVFADLPRFDPSLAEDAGPRALGYIGVGELGPALNKAIATAGAGAQGLVGSLRALAQNLQQEAGVDPLKDLLPALGGQAALVAEPTDSFPFASLIVDGVDEKKANDALARLQQPILRSLGTGGPQVPTFSSKEVDGVTVHSVQVSGTVNLSYAVFDGRLVISTQPEGIAQVRDGGDSLAGTSGYKDATDELPNPVSALVFLNLDEVFGLAQQAGLATDPLYASLSEDISRIGSLGLGVRGSEDELKSELFLAIND